MEKEFVPYEQSLELKELGFDEPCFGWTVPNNENFVISPCEKYNGRQLLMTQIPIYQQAFKWFREKYNLHSEPYTADMGAIEYCFQIRDLYSEKYIYDNFVGVGSSYSGTFNTPEESEIECLKKLIEIVKEK
jgi:hypothetical protein